VQHSFISAVNEDRPDMFTVRVAVVFLILRKLSIRFIAEFFQRSRTYMLFHEQFCKNEAFSVEISAISECPRLFSPKLLTQRQMLGDCRHKFCGHILVFGAEPLTSCLSLSFRRHADLSATNVMSVSPT